MNASGLRRIVVASIGSSGDIYPFLALAGHLRDQGHQVYFLTNPYYADEVRRCGLELLPVGSAQQIEAAARDAGMWQRHRGGTTVWTHLIAPTLGALREQIAPIASEGETLVLVHPMYVPAADIARATTAGVDVVALHLCPMTFPSGHWLTRPPEWLPMGIWNALCGVLEPRRYAAMRHTLNQVRASHGLAPVDSLLAHAMQAPARHVPLFPRWIAPHLAQPTPRETPGDFLFRAPQPQADDAALTQFLQAGPPPVLVTFGTGHRQAQAAFRTAVNALRPMGRRAILLCADRTQLPPTLPATTLWLAHATLHQLLPNVSVVIHHGGIGTMAEALRAGKPQIVTPFAFDQFSNAAIAQRLGVALTRPASQLNERWLQRALARIEACAATARSCQAAAARVNSGPGIEGIARSVLARPSAQDQAASDPARGTWPVARRWVAAMAVLVAVTLPWRATGSLQAAPPSGPESEQAIELAQVDLALAQTAQLTRGVPLSGALRATHSAFVKSRAMGELQDLSLREGDTVRQGQVIARVRAADATPRLRQARELAQSALAQVEIAQRQFDSNESLVQQGFISKSAADNSRAALASARAQWQAAQAAAQAAGDTIDDAVLRAPITGVVAQRFAQQGEWVTLDSRVMEIVDPSRLEVEASVSAADSVQVRLGQRGQLRVEGLDEPVAATVIRIHPNASASTRSVAVYLSVPVTPGLRQGLFVHGQLATGSTEGVSIPLSALRTDRPTPYVQLIEDSRVVHRQVTPGARGELAARPQVIVSGLATGSLVLLGHVAALREGSRVRLPDPVLTPAPPLAPVPRNPG